MWRRSPFVALAGLIVTIVLWWPAHSMRGIVARSATTTFVCCLAFVVISLAARSHWSCTFDEGFHLTRGLALRHFHDARLSFFHPPLQNSLGGYFANLAFGDRLKYPVTDALQRGDALTYATEFAKANGDVFNEAVRASRWAPMHFGMLLVAVGVWWGRKIGGDLAGWLAGIGLALNPNLIAHANLNTTDIGVTALAIAGTALLWRAGQKQSLFSLAFTVIVFALASMTKFTGLIWLGSLLVLVVPLLTWRWRDGRALLAIPVGLAAFVILLFVFYGSPDRFFAGLTAQTSHAFSGHKAWFHGQFFGQSSWWHLPAAVILKSPEVWLIAVVLALVLFVVGARERRRTERGSRAAATNEWLPFVPAIVFAFLLFFVNNMAIGVRHALPLIALGTIAGAVAIAKIGVERWRKAAAGIFAGGMIFSAGISFPNYIAYFPAWAGGTENGFRWLVDSNYDWGQGLDELEEKWAALTEENGGQSPNLIYYGFSDPRVTHKLRVGPNSYCGFMDAISSTNLNERVNGAKGILVVSISAPPLRPHGLDFKILRDAEFVRRIGPSFEVFRLK